MIGMEATNTAIAETESVQVIVAGAGPVGTFAAYLLASMGIEVLLCEAGPDCAQDLRASTFHPPTMEMLEKLGLADEIVDRGLKAPIYHFRERQTGEVIEFDLTELADHTKFPFRVQCEQHVMAGLLAQRLTKHPKAEVKFGHRLTHFSQTDTGVEVSLENSRDIVKVKANYLIAADGGGSIVRKWLNAQFDGFTYPEKFLTLSTKLELGDHIKNLAYVSYVSDPEEWLVLLRVPSVWRILVPASEDQPDDFLLSDDYKEQVLTRLTGISNVETEHRTIYRVHQRVVTRFDHGRVFLVGDAAHLNNPLGGFGMNSGIHDAQNLCEKVVHCLSQGHDNRAFELFGRQRHATTHNFIQAQTIQNKLLMEHGASAGQKQRLEQMRFLSSDQEQRRAFLLKQAMFTSLQEANAQT